MRLPLRLIGAAPLFMTGPSISAAPFASSATTIRLEVPVICKVVHRGDVIQQGNHYSLGKLHAYCNSPRGFVVQLDYEPGSFRGAVVQAGEERVTLDGSGQSEIMRSSGPRISTVELTAIAARDRLDGNAFQFQIVPL